MKKLFLASYLAGVKTLVGTWLEEKRPEEILFVPTAANVEEYTDYVEEAADTFAALGYRVKRMDFSKFAREECERELQMCDSLYVSGGNTFYLLQELRRKNLLGALHERIEEGMLYIGESAGAMITARNIAYGQIMDDKKAAPDLKDMSGLSVVDFYILPHRGEEPFVEAVEETLRVYDGKLEFLTMDNSEAVIVDGAEHRVEREA